MKMTNKVKTNIAAGNPARRSGVAGSAGGLAVKQLWLVWLAPLAGG